ncbi:FecCD family ABC transporter permease [Blastococcus saxobsidens]|uniref:FecCD family ABC transporter permease n=1 Tax=Blastococcus saxobsidens TaxID=138336 RepID=UPI0018D2BFAA|nr:iron ABC transporter permease [Blastococcus saxobsidens]
MPSSSEIGVPPMVRTARSDRQPAPVSQTVRPDQRPAPVASRRAGGLRPALLSVGLLASLGVLVATILVSLRFGSVPLSTATAIEAFTTFDGSTEHLIVRKSRLPRTVIGLGVGAALAVAGVGLQAVTRNPLGSPEILGLNAGASFAVVTAVHLFGIVSPSAYIWFAFAGALVAMTLVFLIASAGRDGATPVKLALSGAVVTALLGSWISAILVLDERTLDQVRFWLAGSLVGRDLAAFAEVAPFLVVGLALVGAMARQFDTLSLGESLAAGLGQRTRAVRAATVLAVVLLAGAAVAAAGPIAFIGLAVPHAVRAVVGPSHGWLLPYSAIYGAVLLLAADVLGRIVARPSEIDVGIMTAIVGAPFLVHLVRSRRLSEL